MHFFFRKIQTMEFRQDIQILRGIAVLFVVLFHLEIAGLSSGFLGVDVFFVVSGFLMALLYKEGEAKKFFERRAKRLLPAYFATVGLTLFASLFLVLPSELGQVVSQSIYSVFFANNIGFWMQNSYFSKSDFNPLLHLWSLGVEIQFYLIVPLLVWFFRKSKILLPFFLLASLAACIFIVGISPKTSFFMMPLRIWEFLIGFAVAAFFTTNGNLKYKNLEVWGLLGLLVLTAIPFINVDGQSLNRMYGHPSFYALLVCLATAFIIVFGLPKRIINSFLGKCLANIGNYSYSIYLVHFPIIVLYLYEPFSGTKLYPESYTDKIILLILIALASILMHKFVEVRRFNKIGRVYLISFIAMLCLTGMTKITPKFYSEEQQNIFNGLRDRATYRCGKIMRITNPGEISCKLNSSKHENSVLLIGNSHADSIKTVFTSVMDLHKYNTYFFVNNTPMMGGVLPPKEIINEALEKRISWIFLHYKSGGLDLNKLEDLVQRSNQENIKVTVILPVPMYEYSKYYESSIPKALFKNKVSTLTYSQYVSKNNDVIGSVKKLQLKFPNFNFLETAPAFCNPICTIGTNDKKPYYFDDDHLTITGAEILRPTFGSIFKQ